MRYVITSDGANIGEVIARRFIDRYSAVDYIMPILLSYDRRLTCSYALVFDTYKEAESYKKRNSCWIPDSWVICEYSACLNSIIRVAKGD